MSKQQAACSHLNVQHAASDEISLEDIPGLGADRLGALSSSPASTELLKVA